jgi:hypothetical protein
VVPSAGAVTLPDDLTSREAEVLKLIAAPAHVPGALGTDDQQELAHRGRWLLQAVIAEVARQPKSRTLVAVVHGPAVRHLRDRPPHRLPRAVSERSEALLFAQGGAGASWIRAKPDCPLDEGCFMKAVRPRFLTQFLYAAELH